jgi:hypothetical protein
MNPIIEQQKDNRDFGIDPRDPVNVMLRTLHTHHPNVVIISPRRKGNTYAIQRWVENLSYQYKQLPEFLKPSIPVNVQVEGDLVVLENGSRMFLPKNSTLNARAMTPIEYIHLGINMEKGCPFDEDLNKPKGE